MAEETTFNADVVCPVINELSSLHAKRIIQDSEFVAIYILLLLSSNKKKYLGGKYKCTMHNSTEIIEAQSITLATIPGLIDGVDLLDGAYLSKKLKLEIHEIKISHIYTKYTLNGIRKNQDNYVNRQIVNWMVQEKCQSHNQGIRKPTLLFHIPNPMQVLEMQCHGTRVVTLFKERHELLNKHVSYLHYMGGQTAVGSSHSDAIIEHEKDALEFLLHDLKHFDNFIAASFYEQVGFFNCLVEMQANSVTKNRIKLFYLNELKYDKQLYLELEYVLSDMNCFLPHMLKYIQAKMRHAVSRVEVCADVCEERFLHDWTLFVQKILHYDALNDKDTAKNQVFHILVEFVSSKEKELRAEEYEVLREYFTAIACNKLYPSG